MKIETKFYRKNEIDDNVSRDAFDIFYSEKHPFFFGGSNVKGSYKTLLNIFMISLSDRPEGFLAITYYEKTPVNIVLVSNTTKENYYFELVATHASYRNFGMAYFAEKNCIKKIREQGGKTVEAYIDPDNTNSKALHNKMGFVKLKNISGLSDDDVISEYKLELDNKIIDMEKTEK